MNEYFLRAGYRSLIEEECLSAIFIIAKDFKLINSWYYY